MRVAGIEDGLDCVDRAGTDVTEDHTERADHDGWAQRLSTVHGSHRCGVHACSPVIVQQPVHSRTLQLPARPGRPDFVDTQPLVTWAVCSGSAMMASWPTNSTSCTRSSRRSSPPAAPSSPQRPNSAARRTPRNRSPRRASPQQRHGSSTGSPFGTRTSGLAWPGSASGCGTPTPRWTATASGNCPPSSVDWSTMWPEPHSKNPSSPIRPRRCATTSSAPCRPRSPTRTSRRGLAG